MSTRPRITIVGAGKLASTLAPALTRAGYPIDAILARDGAVSLRRAKHLAKQVGAIALTANRAPLRSDIVWLCVPDSQITRAATALATKGVWKGRVVLHSSGALTSDELAALRRRGAAVASIHPLMSFVLRAQPSLAGVPFAIEGDSHALRVARAIVKDLGGQSFAIRKKDKAAYHAWGTFASPLLTALLATTERVAAAAGIDQKAARSRMLPILKQTLSNYALLGAPGAFSGPVIRGDSDTVQKHLRNLQRIPVARDVYVALARAALEYLPSANKMRIRKVLSKK